MSAVRFGEINQLMNVTGVAGAAFFEGTTLGWNRIPAYAAELVEALGMDVATLCAEYREVGRSIEELYFCFQTSAWVAIVRNECLLMVHLDNGAPLGRVIAAGRHFLDTASST